MKQPEHGRQGRKRSEDNYMRQKRYRVAEVDKILTRTNAKQAKAQKELELLRQGNSTDMVCFSPLLRTRTDWQAPKDDNEQEEAK